MSEEQIPETLSSLVIRWLRGANTGSVSNLYISRSEKGIGLFLNKGKRNNVLVASLEGGIVRLFTIYDGLGIRPIAQRLGMTVLDFPETSFFENGYLDKNKLV